MRYEKVYQFIIPKLDQELPAYLTYHNSLHTKDAFRSAAHLCDAEKVSRHEKELLLTAVLFHDSGFLKTYEGHEEESCELAKRSLPGFGYDKKEIDTICDLIMATKMHYKPTTLLEKIIRDADVHYLGTHHYSSMASNLYEEYKHQGYVHDDKDWHEKQLLFLHEQEYFTKAANRKYGALKRKNMQMLAFKNKKGKKHVSRAVAATIDWGLIVVGALAAGFGLNRFLVPNQIFDGGVSGIALLINNIFGFDLSILIILLNLPIIIISYFSAGKNFALKTTIGIILLGVSVHFIPHDQITRDKILVAVFGGFFIGLGSGLAIRGGSVLDGSEILAMQTIKRTSFTISEIILAINVLIFSVAALKFGLERAMYSTLTYLAASQTIGYVIEGVEAYTGVTIISRNSELIKRRVVNELGRGITVYKGERGFLPGSFEISEDVDIIFTVITRLELSKLKKLVQQADPKAFVFANTIKEAAGGIIKRKSGH